MILLAGRHIYGKSHVDLIVETFPDLPVVSRARKPMGTTVCGSTEDEETAGPGSHFCLFAVAANSVCRSRHWCAHFFWTNRALGIYPEILSEMVGDDSEQTCVVCHQK
jgi:hypothetical protein